MTEWSANETSTQSVAVTSAFGVGWLAVVGMSGRFPGARNIAEFWDNLIAGKESIAFFSNEELEEAGFDPAIVSDPRYVKAKGVLEDVQWFDASFFSYSPREAEAIDPQHRIFLECAWEALEDAGYDPQRYDGAVGIYAGASLGTYLLMNLMANPEVAALLGNYQIAIGNDKDHLTTRVSYKLNLRGPSVTIQTTCSTSLVAVCVACQSLLDFQCDMALAGGVSITLPEKVGYFYQEGGILSPDGHCRVFDAEAKGIVGGNGAGVVVLKRLEDALREGDHIYAVVRGIALNNDGAGKVGYTAPSVEGQAEVIAMAQAMAEVDPETITYIEAHGTGTPLGDPIEVAALTQVFRRRTAKKGFCGIGSVKSNIGHLDAAAGVAGLIKTALALEKGMLPPSLHFKAPNPQIDFSNSPFYVCQKPEAWRQDGTPRRAGVSSFGIGGTNAHVVLEEPPAVGDSGPAPQLSILTLSAQTASALDQIGDRLAVFLRENPALKIADIAYTLQIGRKAWSYRWAIVCSSIAEAVDVLEGARVQELSRTRAETKKVPIAFMFPGQGSQYPNMARGIYEAEVTFRDTVDKCAEFLKPQLGLDLRTVMFGKGTASPVEASQLDQTWLTQPTLFVIEYALATLWMSWGIQPTGMVGHSIGEYVAACLGGVFELHDALTLVALRGRLMQALPEGAMLSVALSEREIASVLTNGVSLAAVNGPGLCVISGDRRQVEVCRRQLAERGVEAQLIRTSHAFHSKGMESIVRPFAEAVGKIKLTPSRIPYISNVTGTWIADSDSTDPNYWARHLCRTVRFDDSVRELLKGPGSILLEVGPGNTLTSLARQQAKGRRDITLIASCRHRQDRRTDTAVLLTALSHLWTAGGEPDWYRFHANERRHRVSLPTYPFERKRYWVAPSQQQSSPSGLSHALPSRKQHVADWFFLPTWRRLPLALPTAANASHDGSTWLVFVDRIGLADRCTTRLKEQGRDVVTVSIGDEFVRLSGSAYAIRAHEAEDYRALVRDIRGQGKILRVIAHFWTVGQSDGIRSRRERVQISRDLAFGSLIFLAQALAGEGVADSIVISVVSTELHDVMGGEPVRAEKALLLGPCRVIPQEYPQITCHSIDVSLSDEWQCDDRLVDGLIGECECTAVAPDVAYRRNYRWIRSFEPTSLVSDEPRPASLLRNEGVYLITGGLGGIGFAIAEHLAKTVKAKLILIGRSVRLHASDAQLADDDVAINQIGERQKLMRLKASGGDVLLAKADVSNHEEMVTVAKRGREQFGPIHGVIHAAGVPGRGIIQLKTSIDIDRVFAPKIGGAMVLADVFDCTELDFLVLFSSLSPIFGGPGQVDYCAANAFLDVFAQEAAMKGARVLSINWDRWAEVGMAVNELTQKQGNTRRDEGYAGWLAHGIRTREGMEAFTSALGIPTPQIAVSPQDLGLLTRHGPPKPTSMGAEPVIPVGDRHPRPDVIGDYVAPSNDIEEKIAQQFESLLGIERVGIHDNFFELGGHSLSGTQLTARLRDVLDIEIPIDLLFNAPTVHTLADVISSMQQDYQRSGARGNEIANIPPRMTREDGSVVGV